MILPPETINYLLKIIQHANFFEMSKKKMKMQKSKLKYKLNYHYNEHKASRIWGD